MNTNLSWTRSTEYISFVKLSTVSKGLCLYCLLNYFDICYKNMSKNKVKECNKSNKKWNSFVCPFFINIIIAVLLLRMSLPKTLSKILACKC